MTETHPEDAMEKEKKCWHRSSAFCKCAEKNRISSLQQQLEDLKKIQANTVRDAKKEMSKLIDQKMALEKEKERLDRVATNYLNEMHRLAGINDGLKSKNEALVEAGRLHVTVTGDFDDGAYGRYDEPVFCGWAAYFTGRSWAHKTPWGTGKTPVEAIEKLYSKVKDKQRLEQQRKALAQSAKQQSGEEDASKVRF